MKRLQPQTVAVQQKGTGTDADGESGTSSSSLEGAELFRSDAEEEELVGLINV